MKHFVMSLDFELRWGIQDRVGDDGHAYRQNLSSVSETGFWLLQCFAEREIACTWATVGAVACRDWEDFMSSLPITRPKYVEEHLDYNQAFLSQIDPNGDLHFLPDLIQDIASSERQELGLHTFGHVYAREPGMTYEAFLCDLARNKDILEGRFSVKCGSLVFPRNQVNFESELLSAGIINCYRGNEICSWDDPIVLQKRALRHRGLAFVHSLYPLKKRWHRIDGADPTNIRSSGMLKVNWRGSLRRRNFEVVTNEINTMPDNSYIHSWFHPHNIGRDERRRKDLLVFLDKVGDAIANNRIKSQNMSSMANTISESNG